MLAITCYCLLKRRQRKGPDSWQFEIERPRSRSQSRLRLNEINDLEDSTRDSLIKSDLGSGLSDEPSTRRNSEKRRNYDRSYNTNEPLPGKPDYEFEEKPWDLPSPASSTPSPIAPTTVKPISPRNISQASVEPNVFRFDSDSDYATVEDTSRSFDDLDRGISYAQVGIPTPFKSADDLLKLKNRKPLQSPTTPSSDISSPSRPMSSFSSSKVTSV